MTSSLAFLFYRRRVLVFFRLFVFSSRPAEGEDGEVERGGAGDDRRSPRRGHEAAGERAFRVQAQPGHHRRRLGDHLHEVSAKMIS